MALLREAAEKRRAHLIEKLTEAGVYSPIEQDYYTSSTHELEAEYKNLCQGANKVHDFPYPSISYLDT